MNLDRGSSRKRAVNTVNYIMIWTGYGRRGGAWRGLFDQSPPRPTVSESPKHLFTRHALFFIFLWISFLPCKVLDSYPLLLSSERHTYLILFDCLWHLHVCVTPPKYKMKFDFFSVNLSRVKWLLVQPEGSWRALPLKQVARAQVVCLTPLFSPL